MGNFSIGLLGELSSFATGTIGGSIDVVTKMIMSGATAVLRYNQEGVALARQMGMNAKEAQAYTSVLIDRAAKLGKTYGIAADQVLELQRNLSETTGKAIMLGDMEAERMIQINKLVGASVANEFTSEMMSHMGGQLSAVQGAISKAYVTGAKSGLDAAKFSEKVAKNLSLANKLSFRDGVNGIIKMTALSEKLGFNLQSVEQAANSFMDFDKAIENAAKLQMLGGAAGAFGGNPLTMAYEANYDPEAFTERMTQTLGGLATFDKSKGIASVNGMNRDIVKAISESMGIGFEEAMSIAKKNAEVTYKENAFGSVLSQYTTEQRDFIINKSYVDANSGHLMMRDVSGNEHDLSKEQLSSKILEELSKFDNMSELDIMKEQAQTLTSIQELAQGYQTSMEAALAKGVQPYLKTVEKYIKAIGDSLLQDIMPRVNEITGKIGDFFNKEYPNFAENIKTIGTAIGNVLGFVAEHFKAFLVAWLAWKGIGWAMKLPWGGNTVGGNLMQKVFSKGGSGAAKAAKGGWRGLTKGIQGLTKSIKSFGTAVAKAPRSIGRAISNASKGGWRGLANSIKGIGNGGVGKTLGAVSKVAKVGGVLAGVTAAIGAGLSMNTYKDTKRTLDEKLAKGEIAQSQYDAQMKEANNEKNAGIGGAIGAVAGGALGSLVGPIGTAAGAVVGDIVGNYVGGKLTEATDYIKEQWNGPIKDSAREAFGEAGVSVVDGIGDIAGGITAGYGEAYEKAASAIGNFTNGLVDGYKTFGKGIWDGFGQIFEGDVLGGLATMGQSFWEGQKAFATGVWDSVKDIFSGLWGYVSNIATGVWNGIQKIGAGAWEILNNAVSTTVDFLSEKFLKALDFWKDWGGKAWDKISGVASKVWDGVTTAISGVIDGYVNTVATAWSKVLDFADGVWDKIYGAASGIWDRILNSADRVWNGISVIGDKVWNKVFGIASEAWEKISGIASTIWNNISGIAENVIGTVGGFATDMWKKVLGIASGVWDNIRGFANGIWNDISGFADKVWNKVFGIADAAWSRVSGIANAVWARISGVADKVWGNITGFANTMWNNISGFGERALNTILDSATKVWDTIGGFASNVWNDIRDIGTNAWNSLLTGVSGIFGDVRNNVSNFATGIWNDVKTSVTSVWDSIKNMITGVWTDFKKGASTIWTDVKNGFAMVWDDIRSGRLMANNANASLSAVTNNAGIVIDKLRNAAVTTIAAASNVLPFGGSHSEGGIVGGNSYEGDRVLARVNSGEMILNTEHQTQLFNFIKTLPTQSSRTNVSNSNVTYYNANDFSGRVGGNSTNVANNWSNIGGPTSSFVGGRVNTINSWLNSVGNSISKLFGGNSTNAANSWTNSVSNIGGSSSVVGGGVNNVSVNTANDLKNITSTILSKMFNSYSDVVAQTIENRNDVKAKPVGGVEYIYVPNNNATSNGVTEVTVKDINVNVSGTIKLDAGNFIKNVDINQLLNDSSFVSSLKELIKSSINNDMNGGRFMNDNATLRGSVGTTTYWGR